MPSNEIKRKVIAVLVQEQSAADTKIEEGNAPLTESARVEASAPMNDQSEE